MMADEVAAAYASIYPKFQGVASGLTKELADAGGKAAHSFSSAFQGPAAVALGNVMSSLAMNAANAFSQAWAAGIDLSDGMRKFETTMEFAGVAADEIDELRDSMKEYADQTVYDLDEVLNTTAKLASNGVDDYDQLVMAMGNLNAVAGGNSESFGYLANAIVQVNGAGKLMSQDWNQIVNALPGASGALKQELLAMGAYEGGIEDFKDAMAAGEISAEEFNQAVKNLGLTDLAYEAATSTETFEGAMGNFEASMADGMSQIYDAINGDGRITGAIVALGDAFVNNIGPVADMISGAIDITMPYVQQAVEWMQANVLPFAQRLGEMVAQHMPQIQALWTGTMTAIGNIVETVWPRIQAIIESAMTIALGIIDTVSALMNNDFDGAMTSIASLVDWAFGDVIDAVTGFWDDTVSSFTEGVSSVLEAFGQIPDELASLASDAGTWLVGVGQQIIEGLCNGISGAVDWVTNAVNSVCENALGALKSFFGIASPSKLMAEMGGYMMAGLSEGIAEGANDAVKSMDYASQQVSDAAQFGYSLTNGMGYGAAAAKTVNVYIDGARVNDDESMRNATRNYLLELNRLAVI